MTYTFFYQKFSISAHWQEEEEERIGRSLKIQQKKIKLLVTFSTEDIMGVDSVDRSAPPSEF